MTARWHWRNWPVLAKLIGVLLIPTLVGLVFGVLYIREKAADAPAEAGWSAVVLLFALALGVLVAILIARAMLGPLDLLRRTALDVADRRLPAAVGSARQGGTPDETISPVPVHTREEIGQVARAFDAVHTQAVRLAGEQSALRGSVNDIFVNLSRRSQGLVQRQLKLIENLESSEENPETLDNLFQLDHLATRMRRNNENLLVLAGTESSRRSGPPQPLVEVLRAAVSEVEQYQRVVLRPPPDALVLGPAAADLVHLLAELLDNATQFSPPESQVVISGSLAADGSVDVAVDDRGVGIGDQERAELNERLASTPAVAASVSRRMGLFVVGRLAARHGIAVALGRGEEGTGTTASVALPARAVQPGADVPDAPAGEEVATAATGPDKGGRLHRRAVLAPDTGELSPNGHPTPHATPDEPAETDEGQDRQPTPAQPAQPAQPAEGSEVPSDLFRSTTESQESHGFPDVEPAAPRVTLNQATPIFDEVISAWFRDSGPDAGLSGGEPGPEPGVGRHAAEPAGGDWGSADEGWHAAEALVNSGSAEFTAAGLPRRRPQAQLVPGAASAGLLPEAGEASRSAESVRGRLSSYQRGVREGRHNRRPEQADEHGGDEYGGDQQGGPAQ